LDSWEKRVGLTARVLIVAGDDRSAGPLADGLDRLGWRTVTARSLDGGLRAAEDLRIEAAILDLSTLAAAPRTAVEALRAACKPRRLPVVGLGVPEAPGVEEACDLMLSTSAHPAQMALRLEHLVRAAVSEEEFELRRATFAERNARLDPPTDADAPLAVLMVGSPSPQVLALTNAMKAIDLDCVGAFTPYTAFDYLHERKFDAVALWGGEDQAEAISIAAGMRRNTRLYHVPTLLYLQQTADLNLAEVFNRGVTDVASLETPETETAQRVSALGRAYRRQATIRQALENARGSGLMDASTGLFTRDLFAAHLVRLGLAARERSRPLSVCVLRVADRPEVAQVRGGGWLDRAMPQIGSMIARLVRAEDTAARLASEVFALALPATPLGHARLVGERIAAVIACTAFESGAGRSPFVVEFDVGVAEVQPGENAARALERAAQASLDRRAAG
jgi:two-component system cell cycle response regulator PopA